MRVDSHPSCGSDFAFPPNNRYFEDYVPGAVYEYGTVRLDERDIVNFGKQYAPHACHTDPEAAARGPFGGLIANGWQTAGVMMRLMVDHFLSKVAGIASPGFDELRFHRPVRPGDSLSIRVTVLEAKRSRSKTGQGVVRNLVEVLNQNRDVVLSMKSIDMLRCRK
jgi:acyl dehydratase